MNKKVFLIYSFMAATAFSINTHSNDSFDPVAGRKLLSILKPINDRYQKASEKMSEKMVDYGVEPYSFNGMLVISAISACLGLGRWACMTGATLFLMNLEAIIQKLEKELEEFENKGQEQEKA